MTPLRDVERDGEPFEVEAAGAEAGEAGGASAGGTSDEPDHGEAQPQLL
jgi:hypothetical protein